MNFEAILSGGFAGAAAVAFLSRVFIQSQLDKAIRQYQHELDLKKNTLQSELTVYVEHAKLRVLNHRQKSVASVEAVYAAFVRTAFSRHGFKKAQQRLAEKNGHELTKAYFDLFSLNFQAFSNAFKSVSAAFACVDENAIYLDPALEREVATALANVHDCYTSWHAKLADAHRATKMNVASGGLSAAGLPIDFDAFYVSMIDDWKRVTGPVKEALKAQLRNLLKPDAASEASTKG